MFTSMIVREDSMTLYGFESADERDVFTKLLSVSGIGPKIALAALAVLRPDDLRRAVRDQDLTALQRIPGVGKKSAQRMAFTLLQRDRSGGMRLAQALTRAMSEIGHCADCRTFTEQEVCNICSNPRRQENGQICVVESPADIYAIEQTGQFSGRYFVLMGHLSPLDGIGPDDIGLDRLEQRLAEEKITEVILATNPTVEGEATANYIAELCAQYDVEASRIAHGVPVGGELEMVDGTTLSHSLAGRHKIRF